MKFKFNNDYIDWNKIFIGDPNFKKLSANNLLEFYSNECKHAVIFGFVTDSNNLYITEKILKAGLIDKCYETIIGREMLNDLIVSNCGYKDFKLFIKYGLDVNIKDFNESNILNEIGFMYNPNIDEEVNVKFVNWAISNGIDINNVNLFGETFGSHMISDKKWLWHYYTSNAVVDYFIKKYPNMILHAKTDINKTQLPTFICKTNSGFKNINASSIDCIMSMSEYNDVDSVLFLGKHYSSEIILDTLAFRFGISLTKNHINRLIHSKLYDTTLSGILNMQSNITLSDDSQNFILDEITNIISKSNDINDDITFQYLLVPVTKAVSCGHISIIKLLVHNGFDILKNIKLSNAIVTAAIQKKKFEILEYMASAGYDFNTPNNIGILPIMTSVTQQSIRVTEWLLKHGADPNGDPKSVDVNNIPLFAACFKGRKSYILNSLLLKYGADVNITHPIFLSPIFKAFKVNSNIIKLYLKNGFDLKSSNPIIKKILVKICGISIPYIDTARSLVEYGMDPNELSIVLNRYHDNVEFLKYVISKGFDIGKLHHGDTLLDSFILDIYFKHHDSAIMIYLIKNNAPISKIKTIDIKVLHYCYAMMTNKITLDYLISVRPDLLTYKCLKTIIQYNKLNKLPLLHILNHLERSDL